MTIDRRAAVVGIGATSYYKRGESLPQTTTELACKAIIAALDDAGLNVDDLDGFAYYNSGFDTALIAQLLGVPDVRFTASLIGGGGEGGRLHRTGGCRSARRTGGRRGQLHGPPAWSGLGAAYARDNKEAIGHYTAPPTSEKDFIAPAGPVVPAARTRLTADIPGAEERERAAREQVARHGLRSPGPRQRGAVRGLPDRSVVSEGGPLDARGVREASRPLRRRPSRRVDADSPDQPFLGATVDTLQLERRDGYAVVRLDRPPVNAVNKQMMREIRSCFEGLSQDRSVSAVVRPGVLWRHRSARHRQRSERRGR